MLKRVNIYYYNFIKGYKYLKISLTVLFYLFIFNHNLCTGFFFISFYFKFNEFAILYKQEFKTIIKIKNFKRKFKILFRTQNLIASILQTSQERVHLVVECGTMLLKGTRIKYRLSPHVVNCQAQVLLTSVRQIVRALSSPEYH